MWIIFTTVVQVSQTKFSNSINLPSLTISGCLQIHIFNLMTQNKIIPCLFDTHWVMNRDVLNKSMLETEIMTV